MKYLILIVISIFSVISIDFIENKLGIKEAIVWGIIAILWSFACLETSQNKSIRAEKIFYKMCFYGLLILGLYTVILGVIDMIKNK